MKMKRLYLIVVCLSICLLQSAKSEIAIYADFPGGNVFVEKIQNDTVWVRPDIRDTEGFWFYWYFAVKYDVGKSLTFVFPPDCFTRAGVSVSIDSGSTWKWEQPDAFNKNSFTYRFESDKEVRFCMSIPYTQKNWEAFTSKYQKDPCFQQSFLTETKKGRKAEMLLIKNPDKTAKAKVLLTARHHACEMMANYVMEGIIDYVMQDSWMKENIEFLCLPFMDKDGVEDGDQGKNRRPRDHNRDYSYISIHETTSAVKELVPVWSENKLKIMLDLHCPWIHSGQNDSIFFVGVEDKKMEARQLYFSDLVKENNKSELVYDPSDFCYYGSKPWTIPSYPIVGMKATTWGLHLKGIDLSVSLEFPYGVSGKQLITAENARLFGHDVAAAMKMYLQKLNL